MSHTTNARREAARAAGDRKYSPIAPCRYGHVSVRYVATNECVDCSAANQKRTRAKRAGKAVPPRIPPAVDAMILQLRREGRSCKAIAEALPGGWYAVRVWRRLLTLVGTSSGVAR